jgi:hypothetical protein
MRDIEICWRVTNKLLNRIMKLKYNYDNFFYLNPVQFIMNRELKSECYLVNEMVSINLNKNIKMYEIDKLCKDLKYVLNHILPMVEGSDFRPVNKVEIKVNKTIVSGTLFGNV